jgi:hypothetical protein
MPVHHVPFINHFFINSNIPRDRKRERERERERKMEERRKGGGGCSSQKMFRYTI